MFNQESRTNNVLKTSFVGTICNLINIILGFVYRTIFIHVLSSNYLGINGLFGNILQILSFADLGIGTAIIYRFYEPISKNDIRKVGQLMNFFRKVYLGVAAVIMATGLCLLPFLNFFIKDTGEIPQDIHLQIIYLLFLAQTLSSYLFVYKQTILSADQKQYIASFMHTLFTLGRYLLQVFVLITTKKYIWTLACSIFLNLLLNFVFSERVSHKYRDVFCVKESISDKEKKEIFEDTKATLCHKIGGTVLSSTDNIILSRYVGITATGMYSNYSMVLSSLSGILNQVFGSFTSSLGNAHVEQNIEQKYVSYRRLLFGNLWVSSICTICLYSLLNDFITIWIGPDMLLDDLTVTVLSIQFFVETARIISMSYTNGCGLFVRDKIRPVIESAINLIVSIAMTNVFGIAGVFIGTIISHLCTVFWREPYLLHKYEFKKSMKEYWICYGLSAFIAAFLCILFSLLFTLLPSVHNLGEWILKALLVFTGGNVFGVIFLHNNGDFLFYKNLLAGKLKTWGKRK